MCMAKIFSVAFMNNFFVHFSPLCVIWQIIYKFNYWGRSSSDDLLRSRARSMHANLCGTRFRKHSSPRHSQTAPLSINYLNFIVLHYYLYQQQQRNEDNNFIPGKDSNVPIKQTPETRTNGGDERRGKKKHNLKPLICSRV